MCVSFDLRQRERAHSPSGHIGQHWPGGVTGFSQVTSMHRTAEQSGSVTKRKIKMYFN